MGDFFAQLRGNIAGTDAVFNQSSIMPDTGGGHGGFRGDPDGRINATSSLTTPGQPYAYAEGGRMGSDVNYFNTPANVQKIVPRIDLPDSVMCDEPKQFSLMHAVSDGDVAFVLRYESQQSKRDAISNSRSYSRQGLLRAVDNIVNLSVVNYLLAGMQVHFLSYMRDGKGINAAWTAFFNSMGMKWCLEVATTYRTEEVLIETEQGMHQLRQIMADMCTEFIRDHARCWGVCIGSDKQGGQHQISDKHVTWPVDYITTITIDGRNENLQNYWTCCEVGSGDSLQFMLQPVALDASWTFDMSSYKYSFCKTLPMDIFRQIEKEDDVFYPSRSTIGAKQEPLVRNSVTLKLLPLQLRPITDAHRKQMILQSSDSAAFAKNYWHFARSQKPHSCFRLEKDLPQYLRNGRGFHRGPLMQTTIAPVWCGGLRTTPSSLTATMYSAPSEYQALHNKEWNTTMKRTISSKTTYLPSSSGTSILTRYTQPIWHPVTGEQQNNTTTSSKRSLSLFNSETTLPTSTCKIPRVAALPETRKAPQLNLLRASSVQPTVVSTKSLSDSSNMNVSSSEFAAAALPVSDVHPTASDSSIIPKHATESASEEPVKSGLRTTQMSVSNIPTISNILDVNTSQSNVVSSCNESNGTFSVVTSKPVLNDAAPTASSEANLSQVQQTIRRSSKAKGRRKLQS